MKAAQSSGCVSCEASGRSCQGVPAPFFFSPRCTYCAIPTVSATQSVLMGERESEILRMACLTLKDIADAIGVPHTTVRNWSAGRVALPEESRPALATFLREHADRLRSAADELEG